MEAEQLTSAMEGMFENPWKLADAPTDYSQRLIGFIDGVEIKVISWEAKLKLSQNHPLENRLGVITGLGATPVVEPSILDYIPVAIEI